MCREEIQDMVRKNLHMNYTSIEDTNELGQGVTDILIRAAELSLLCKGGKNIKVKRKNKMWFDKTLHQMKKDVKNNSELLQKYPHNPTVRHNFFSSLKSYNKARKRKARHFKENIMQQLDELKDSNPEKYWKLLKELRGEDQDGKNKQISLNEWELYFKYLNKEKFCKMQQMEVMTKLITEEKEVIFNETDFKITQHEISKCIKKLKNKKSSGIDRIIPEMLKYSQHILLPNIEKLFNYILTTGKYPDKWLCGYIIPIHKKGELTDPCNYRGITIISCLGKLFNMIINERLLAFFKSKNIIGNSQIGFNKGSRTTDHIFVLHTLINKYMAKGEKIYACFVDLKKAFDSVNRLKLLLKLKATGIGTLTYTIIKDMYTRSKGNLCVKIGNELTNSFKSEVGLYQGDVLSPLLFNLYINDLTKYLDKSCDPVELNNSPLSCLMYADDIVLLSKSENGLQRAIDKLNNYCNTWDLKVNTVKTKVLVFNKGGKVCKTNIVYDNHKIESEQSYKYLGMLLTANGTLTKTRIDLSKRGQKAIFKLKTMFKQATVGFHTSMRLFDHIIKPILLYGSDIIKERTHSA